MWKKYDDEFKRTALNKLFDGQSVRSVATELGVNESLIHTAVGNAPLKLSVTEQLQAKNYRKSKP